MSQARSDPQRSQPKSASRESGGGRSVIASTMLILTMLVIYYPTTLEFYTVWNSILTYFHGFIVGPLAFGFIVLGAQHLDLDWRAQSPRLVIATACVGVLWAVAYLSATQVVQQLALIALLYFGLAGLFGQRGIKTFLLPISILVMATPIWSILVNPLVTLTTGVNTWLLTSLGRTAYIDGNTVQLASGAFQIVDGCSGIHFFIVGQILAIVAAHVYLETIVGKAALLLCTAAITIVSNWLRVFIIIIAGDLTNMQHYLVRIDHYYFGWVLFACLMFPFLLIVRRVGDLELTHLQNVALEKKLQGFIGHAINIGLGPNRFRVGPLLLMIALFGGPAYVYYLDVKATRHFGKHVDLPSAFGSWMERDQVDSLALFTPEYSGADSETSKVFQADDVVVSIYLNRYDRQRQGAELVGYDNKPFGDYDFVSHGKVLIEELGIGPASFELSGFDERLIALRIFIVGDTGVASELKAKLLTGIYSLFGVRSSGVVIIASPCDPDCADAELASRKFLGQAWPLIIGREAGWPELGDQE